MLSERQHERAREAAAAASSSRKQRQRKDKGSASVEPQQQQQQQPPVPLLLPSIPVAAPPSPRAVAVVGSAYRLSGAVSPCLSEEGERRSSYSPSPFLAATLGGGDAAAPTPADRWDADASYSPSPSLSDSSANGGGPGGGIYARFAAWLPGSAAFECDAAALGLGAPRDAAATRGTGRRMRGARVSCRVSVGGPADDAACPVARSARAWSAWAHDGRRSGSRREQGGYPPARHRPPSVLPSSFSSQPSPAAATRKPHRTSASASA